MKRKPRSKRVKCLEALRRWAAKSRLKAALLLFSTLNLPAASVTLAWEPSAGAVEYAVFSGPLHSNYDQSALTTNTSHTVTNLGVGTYKIGVVALGRDNGSEFYIIYVTLREEVLWIEEATALTGPWQVVGSNVLVRPMGIGHRFYRGRMEKP